MASSAFNLKNLIEHALHKPQNLATESELIEYANAAVIAFERADADSSEFLSIKELSNLCSEMGLPMEDDEEEALMKIDADDSGEIGMEEWISWWLKRVSCLPNPLKQQEAIAKNTFRKFDTDNSGCLDSSELEELIASLGAKFSQQEMTEVIKQLDSDNSGVIELNEFVDWWVQRSANSRSGGGLIAMKLRKLARKAAQIFFTDIFTAVWDNNINLVRTFLESDRRIGSASDVSDYGDGWTPLHYACYRGYIDIVKELLLIKDSDNININATNNLGFSALFYAAQCGHIEICEYLLSKGADPAVSGTALDSNIFMCAVDHTVDNKILYNLFKSHSSCLPPSKPSTEKIIPYLTENKGILSIEIPPFKSFSKLPIKKWHVILSVLLYDDTISPVNTFESFANGLDPNKSRDNSNNYTIYINIDKKWLSSNSHSDGSYPNFSVKISGINSLNDEGPFSEQIKVNIISGNSNSQNNSVLNSPKRKKDISSYENENNNDDKYDDYNDTKDHDYDNNHENEFNHDDDNVKDEEIEKLRREIEGEGEDDLNFSADFK